MKNSATSQIPLFNLVRLLLFCWFADILRICFAVFVLDLKFEISNFRKLKTE
jgi:hypothetical protein